MTNSVSTLIARTNARTTQKETRAQVDRHTIVFMGVEIEGVEDYTNECLARAGLDTGLNEGILYRFIPGNAFTKQEFIQEVVFLLPKF